MESEQENGRKKAQKAQKKGRKSSQKIKILRDSSIGILPVMESGSHRQDARYVFRVSRNRPR